MMKSHSFFWVLLFALTTLSCSTTKESESNDQNSEGNNGYYMYIVVSSMDASNEEMVQIKKDVDFMLEKIPGVIEFTTGTQDFANGKYNLAIVVKFVNKSAKTSYSTNPYRQSFVDQYGNKVGELEIVEYEVN